MDKKTEVMNQMAKLEEEKDDTQKKKRLWEEYQEHWAYLQREEQSVLEEVAFLSHGTVSMNHAAQQLTYFEEEKQAVARTFDSIDEDFEQKEKAFYDREDQLNTAYYEAKKQEETNDDEV